MQKWIGVKPPCYIRMDVFSLEPLQAPTSVEVRAPDSSRARSVPLALRSRRPSHMSDPADNGKFAAAILNKAQPQNFSSCKFNPASAGAKMVQNNEYIV